MAVDNNLFGVACKTCRRRGRPCDRSLPSCKACALRGVKCEGYVLRWVGATGQKWSSPRRKQRVEPNPELCKGNLGHSFEMQALRAPYCPAKASRTLLPSNELTYATTDGRRGKRQAVPQAVSYLRQPSIIRINKTIDIRDGLGGLVQYYSQEISTAFYLGQGQAETPCTRHILPMSRSIPSMRCVVAATAACHLANRSDRKILKQQSLHLQLQATKLLREELTAKVNGPELPDLICMLLLAQLDLCSGDCVEFGTHLEAASTFIRQRGGDGTEQGYVEQRIAWLDIMGATTSSRIPHCSLEDVKTTLGKFRKPSGERVWGFDVFYCPVDLFEYIAEITILRKSRLTYQEMPQSMREGATSLGNAVSAWDNAANSGPRYHITEIWRLGILLYLVRIFHLPDNLYNTAYLIECIFHHARTIPPKTSWRFATSWPLFQTGLHLAEHDSRNKTWLRNELCLNYQILGCFHQKLAVEALEDAWRSGDGLLFDLSGEGSKERKLIL